MEKKLFSYCLMECAQEENGLDTELMNLIP